MLVNLKALEIEPRLLSSKKEEGPSLRVGGRTYRIEVQKVQKHSGPLIGLLSIIFLGVIPLGVYGGFAIGKMVHFELPSMIIGGALGLIVSSIAAHKLMNRNETNPCVEVTVTDIASGHSITQEALFDEVVIYNNTWGRKGIGSGSFLNDYAEFFRESSKMSLDEIDDLRKLRWEVYSTTPSGMIPDLTRSAAS